MPAPDPATAVVKVLTSLLISPAIIDSSAGYQEKTTGQKQQQPGQSAGSKAGLSQQLPRPQGHHHLHTPSLYPTQQLLGSIPPWQC